MLIDKDYFWGDLLVPNTENVDGPGYSSKVVEANITTLNRFISKYERCFLIDLLGDLGEEFIRNADSSEFKDLRDILVDDENKISPIANYVYFFYRRNYTTDTTGVGEVVTNTDNATVVSPDNKVVSAWNEMVDMLLRFERQVSGLNYRYRRLDNDLFTKINTFNI